VSAHPGGLLLLQVNHGSGTPGETAVVDARSAAVTYPAQTVDPGALTAVDDGGGIVDARGTVHAPGTARPVYAGPTVLRGLATSSVDRLVAVGPGRTGPVSLLRAPEGSPLQWESLAEIRLGNHSLQLAGDVVARARAVDVHEPWWAAITAGPWRTAATRVFVTGILGLLVAGLAVVLARRPRPGHRYRIVRRPPPE
jgi:hypothetical protein